MERLCLLLPALMLALAGGCSVASVGTARDLRTPLERAAQDGDAAEVRRLLASGADPNDRGGVFGCPLSAATVRPGNAEVVTALLRAGAHPEGRPPEGRNCWVPPVYHAAMAGDVAATQILFDAGASLGSPSPCSSFLAAWLDPAILDVLVAHGFDLRALDGEARNQLHLAFASRAVPRPDAVAYLIARGVPVNARDRCGRTPLAYWHEPRDFETHWFRTWLLERLSPEPLLQRERSARREITAALSRAGAVL